MSDTSIGLYTIRTEVGVSSAWQEEDERTVTGEGRRQRSWRHEYGWPTPPSVWLTTSWCCSRLEKKKSGWIEAAPVPEKFPADDSGETGEERDNRRDRQAQVRFQVQGSGGECTPVGARIATHVDSISGEAPGGFTDIVLSDCAMGCSPLWLASYHVHDLGRWSDAAPQAERSRVRRSHRRVSTDGIVPFAGYESQVPKTMGGVLAHGVDPLQRPQRASMEVARESHVPRFAREHGGATSSSPSSALLRRRHTTVLPRRSHANRPSPWLCRPFHRNMSMSQCLKFGRGRVGEASST